MSQVLPKGAQLHVEDLIVKGDQAVVELHDTIFELVGEVDVGRAVAKMLLRRAAFRGQLDALFCDIDLLIVPVMNVAAPTLADLAAAGRACGVNRRCAAPRA